MLVAIAVIGMAGMVKADPIGFTPEFQGEVRWGGGTWELGMVDLNPGYSPTQTKNLTWPDVDNSHSFEFVYDGTSADLTVKGQTVTGTFPGAGVNSFVLRVFDSETPFSRLTNMTLDIAGDLFSLPDLGGVSGSSTYTFRNSALSGGFKITGTGILSGSDPPTPDTNRPSNSDPAYQIKVGTLVPEPSTLALVGAGLLGLGFVRRRRDH